MLIITLAKYKCIKYTIEIQCDIIYIYKTKITKTHLQLFFLSAPKLTCLEKYDGALRIARRSELLGMKLDFDGIHHAARHRLSIKLSDRRPGLHGLPCRIHHIVP